MPDLRYPVGPLELVLDPSPAQIADWIEQIAETPARLRTAVAGLSEAQLATPYRPDGWTVRRSPNRPWSRAKPTSSPSAGGCWRMPNG